MIGGGVSYNFKGDIAVLEYLASYTLGKNMRSYFACTADEGNLTLPLPTRCIQSPREWQVSASRLVQCNCCRSRAACTLLAVHSLPTVFSLFYIFIYTSYIQQCNYITILSEWRTTTSTSENALLSVRPASSASQKFFFLFSAINIFASLPYPLETSRCWGGTEME